MSIRKIDGLLIDADTLDGGAGITFTELVGGQNQLVTQADTWEDYDLSAIIGEGAKAVLIMVNTYATGSHGCRKKGSALERRFSWARWETEQEWLCFICECDASRVIQIRAPSTSDCKFNIWGYWS